MNIPMREKYVDEAVGNYIVFGWRPDGTVDVSNGFGCDVFTGLPPTVAEQVVQAHDAFRERLYQILCNQHQEPT